MNYKTAVNKSMLEFAVNETGVGKCKFVRGAS